MINIVFGIAFIIAAIIVEIKIGRSKNGTKERRREE
jgi:hypothetical protein